MIRIALLSDLHLPPERGELVSEVDVWATFESCLHGICELGVDLIVVGGDLLIDGKSGHYGEVGRILLSCGIPVHIALGNHDDRDVYRRTAPEELQPGTEVAACHSFDHGDLHVVILDSATGNGTDSGTLGGVQIQWLAEDLAATGDRGVLMFLHHPPVDIGVAWLDAVGLSDRAEFWRCVEPYSARVRGVFCSHGHMHRTTLRGSTLVSTSPSAAFQFSGVSHKGESSPEPPGYLVIDVLPSSVVVQSIRLQSTACIAEGH